MSEQEALLAEILEAIKAQTAAINRMVELQTMLIQALAEDQDIEEEPITYMDGSPVL